MPRSWASETEVCRLKFAVSRHWLTLAIPLEAILAGQGFDPEDFFFVQDNYSLITKLAGYLTAYRVRIL